MTQQLFNSWIISPYLQQFLQGYDQTLAKASGRWMRQLVTHACLAVLVFWLCSTFWRCKGGWVLDRFALTTCSVELYNAAQAALLQLSRRMFLVYSSAEAPAGSFDCAEPYYLCTNKLYTLLPPFSQALVHVRVHSHYRDSVLQQQAADCRKTSLYSHVRRSPGYENVKGKHGPSTLINQSILCNSRSLNFLDLELTPSWNLHP